MADEMDITARLSLAQWHLTRSDQLRLGLIGRAGGILSANALVITGVVLISGFNSSPISPIIGALTLVSLAATTYSTISAIGVFTGSRFIPEVSIGYEDRIPIAFSYSDTISKISSAKDFHHTFTTQTTAEILDAAALELWRCICVHHARTKKLGSATRWMLISAATLIAAAAARIFLGIF
ncbi:hypothetical protein [Microbispora sp. NBRC 16548]|uniref:hypothetical protein n=1 Tax=Microbispora sp. NBRC 16548 TaxID=3030994 RepID=UPI0024A2F640|nr:hypothetical protein [Microbispora sp. NBRC 16548]GLX04584.1 hypothetical protein Misp03_15110 [Microbispora sp. NBRC 16548]